MMVERREQEMMQDEDFNGVEDDEEILDNVDELY
jgi:hypothetical protein